MSAIDLYESFQSYLGIKYRVESKVGNQINVGENFTIRILVVNTAPTEMDKPRIAFKNIKTMVSKTDYAKPKDSDIVHLNLPLAKLLRPGESSYVDVELTATGNMAGQEKVAKVSLYADIDQDFFFGIRKNIDVWADIEPT